MAVKRCEIYNLNLIEKDSKGVEIGKARPALVVQTDLWNKLLPSTIIVPLTSKVPAYTSAATVVLNKSEFGLDKTSTLLLGQMRSIDKSRLEKRIGVLPQDKMEAVDRALSLTLGLESIE